MSGDALVWLCIPDGSAWLAFFQSDRCRTYKPWKDYKDLVFVACKYQYIDDMYLENCFEAYRTVTPMCVTFDVKEVLSLW